ncbi:hypothetical protein NFI95_05185 [Acetobacteraceae bacterium KSS8]|uniref:Uncharacterized protein n=1 Tax=Endosaccharibacter trunci TaxID=2812733 RepID=A0ABT1W4P3_9PROT|nr:hypothetical protein [Acetobacteraceae bacterium KSS8]
MQLLSLASRRTLVGAVLIGTSLALTGCAGGSDTPASNATSTPQQHSPLAEPPASMMTPHGY